MITAYERQLRYRAKNPWGKYYSYISNRCSKNQAYGKKGIKNFLNTANVKALWFRDEAYNMIRPSTDRIDNDGHYTMDNTRFIELSDNVRRARLGKPLLEISKKKIGEANRGKHLSRPTEFKKGHKHSKETRKKISVNTKIGMKKWKQRKLQEEIDNL